MSSSWIASSAFRPGVFLVGAMVAVAVSPLLAGWSAALADGVREGWWRPRRVSLARWVCVAAVAVVFALTAGTGQPWPAWVLLAAAGAVLAVVDAQTRLLPARLVYPLAAAEAFVLVVAAIVDGDGERLLRAVLAAAAVTLVWFTIRFIAPSAVGLGDVRLYGLTAGLLGWVSWWAVLYGQFIAALLGALTAIVLLVAFPAYRRRGAHIPMGPAIIAGAMLASWVSIG